jgi:hypothetical protein
MEVQSVVVSEAFWTQQTLRRSEQRLTFLQIELIEVMCRKQVKSHFNLVIYGNIIIHFDDN